MKRRCAGDSFYITRKGKKGENGLTPDLGTGGADRVIITLPQI